MNIAIRLIFVVQMDVKLYMIGKTDMPFVAQGMDQYIKRVQRYIKFDVHVLQLPRSASKLPREELKKKEAELIAREMETSSYSVLLDENGIEMNSRDFSAFLQKRMNHVSGTLSFFIGGAYGFTEELKQKADKLVSLSPMTFSHQLIRLIFAEQLYRAFSILRNEPYHND